MAPTLKVHFANPEALLILLNIAYSTECASNHRMGVYMLNGCLTLTYATVLLVAQPRGFVILITPHRWSEHIVIMHVYGFCFCYVWAPSFCLYLWTLTLAWLSCSPSHSLSYRSTTKNLCQVGWSVLCPCHTAYLLFCTYSWTPLQRHTFP